MLGSNYFSLNCCIEETCFTAHFNKQNSGAPSRMMQKFVMVYEEKLEARMYNTETGEEDFCMRILINSLLNLVS